MKIKNTFIDLFAGCGGLSEGFYKQDFRALTHIEYDHYACETLKDRMRYYKYPENKISVLEKDITDNDIINKINYEIGKSNIDIIIGGPPCQSYSSLGRAKDKKGMKYDPRNYLFESYEKILNNFKPKIFLFENVMGLLTAKLGTTKTIEVIIRKLSKKYNLVDNVDQMVLNSCDYGVPQIRKRVFLIGLRKDIDYNIENIYKNIKKTHYNPSSSYENKINKKKYVTVKNAIGDLPYLRPGEGDKIINFKPKYFNKYINKIRSANNFQLMDHVARTHNENDMIRYKEMSKNKWTFEQLLEKKNYLNHTKQRVFNNSYVVQFWDKPSRTIIAHLYKDGNQFIHPDFRQQRTLTVREVARLQSFPDNFFFNGSRTQQYKQIGNAVPPLMSEQIAKSIKQALKDINGV